MYVRMKLGRGRRDSLDSTHDVLTIVAAPPLDVTPTIDIVMIHGLGGGAQSTWCKGGKAELFWPRLWLPSDLPEDTRISTFSYDAHPSSKSKAEVGTTDFAATLLDQMREHNIGSSCHVIFIAHDLGGLVVKMAYILALGDRSGKYDTLLPNIRTMIFLGTPHRGSIAYKRFTRTFHSTKRYVEELLPNSLTQERLNEMFPNICIAGRLKVCSFYEASSNEKDVMLPKDLAVMGIRGERNERLQTDHENLCKYSSREDPNYKTLLNIIDMAIRGVGEKEWDP